MMCCNYCKTGAKEKPTGSPGLRQQRRLLRRTRRKLKIPADPEDGLGQHTQETYQTEAKEVIMDELVNNSSVTVIVSATSEDSPLDTIPDVTNLVAGIRKDSNDKLISSNLNNTELLSDASTPVTTSEISAVYREDTSGENCDQQDSSRTYSSTVYREDTSGENCDQQDSSRTYSSTVYREDTSGENCDQQDSSRTYSSTVYRVDTSGENCDQQDSSRTYSSTVYREDTSGENCDQQDSSRTYSSTAYREDTSGENCDQQDSSRTCSSAVYREDTSGENCDKQDSSRTCSSTDSQTPHTSESELKATSATIVNQVLTTSLKVFSESVIGKTKAGDSFKGQGDPRDSTECGHAVSADSIRFPEYSESQLRVASATIVNQVISKSIHKFFESNIGAEKDEFATEDCANTALNGDTRIETNDKSVVNN